MSSNRRQRRAIIARNTFFRVVPMEVKDHVKGVDLQDAQGSIQIIDQDFNDVVVVRLPNTTSYDMAEEIGNRLKKVLDQNVVLLTNNIELCRVEGPLGKKELAEVFKGVDNDKAEDIAETLLEQAITKAKAEGHATDDADDEEESELVQELRQEITALQSTVGQLVFTLAENGIEPPSPEVFQGQEEGPGQEESNQAPAGSEDA